MTEHRRMLTFRGGGWAILLAALISLGLLTWAVAPALRRSTARPPGDGATLESYGFDLSNLAVPRDLVVPGMLHRDMVPALHDPAVLTVEQVAAANKLDRGKFLVGTDRVIGLELNGEARAYPIALMNVHEIVNDTLGGIPIAVTYHWPCDSAAVFDRRVNGAALQFAVSGLLYNANLLMYDQTGEIAPAGAARAGLAAARPATPAGALRPSLWSQLLGRAVAGPAAERGAQLQPLAAQLVSWQRWLEAHPHTTVLDRHPQYRKRYAKAAPTAYFQSSQIPFPVRPLPPAIGGEAMLKSPVIAVSFGDLRRAYLHATILARADDRGEWAEAVGGATIRFAYDRASKTVAVTIDPPRPDAEIIHAFRFAWHAMHPDDGSIQ